MSRYRLVVRYDGTEFSGSQFNPGSRTVDGTLKSELEKLTGQPVHLLWAGRTDTGVHAEGNVVAFDADLSIPAANLPVILNSHLPDDLRVRSTEEVPADFHPRFDAVRREYAYRVYLGEDVPIDRQRYVAAYGSPWHADLIEQSLGLFAGEHCFVNLCQRAMRDQGVKTVRRPDECWCTLDQPRADYGGAEVSLRFKANRFLRNMIRRLVAAVLAVNDGSLQLETLAAALSTEENDLQLKPAPAKGLTLLSVEYKG